METGGLLIDQQTDLHMLRSLGHRCGKQIDRVSGGQNMELAVVLSLGGGGPSAGGEEEHKGAQKRRELFHRGSLSQCEMDRSTAKRGLRWPSASEGYF